MALSAQEILFILELIFWPPTLAVAVYVATRQGFSRQLGWFSLCLLGTFRIIGAATGIAALNSPTEGLIETSMICQSVGLISLVGALTGLIFRVHLNMPPAHSLLGPFTARIVHLVTLGALVLSILAGTDFASTNSASDQIQGQKFLKVAIGLLSAVFLVVGALAVFTRTHQMGHITALGEPRLVNVCVIVLPFIAVRLIYAWLGACLSENSIFSIFSERVGAIVVRAFMQIAMELLVAGIMLWAGLTVPKSQRQHQGRNDLNSGYGSGLMRQTRGGKTSMLRTGLGNFSGRGNAQQENGIVTNDLKPAEKVQEV